MYNKLDLLNILKRQWHIPGLHSLAKYAIVDSSKFINLAVLGGLCTRAMSLHRNRGLCIYTLLQEYCKRKRNYREQGA